ncbi:MAG: MmcQ/YjbR family DNA-binding protein, partial [Chlorobi bacterium]|nr:MmcQ/YjbR family DNA-binding protein [Chlorobiota bacterium]
MNLETFREFCLSLKDTSEDTPFDETTLVFRVNNRIFAITDLEDLPFRFNLKCDPERAIELREEYDCVIPGYHCSKKHWNTIIPDETISDDLIIELTKHSYQLIFDKLKKADKERI